VLKCEYRSKTHKGEETHQLIRWSCLQKVAWRQIIGLDLKTDEEIGTFHNAAKDYMKSVSNLLLVFVPKWMIHRTRGYKARQYLVGKIEDSIDSLLRNGPDGSTMSTMVFAADEEDETKRLSRQQIIDNALILIIAGSDTSALTLTNIMLLLGMHPEQEALWSPSTVPL
jgi:cytochrome P450